MLLCDEPLAARDLRHQQEVAALFVTHDVNAVLPYVDLILYLAAGSFRVGTPDEVLTSQGLTELYGAPVDVVRAQGRVIVVPSSEGYAPVRHHSQDDHGVVAHVGRGW